MDEWRGWRLEVDGDRRGGAEVDGGRWEKGRDGRGNEGWLMGGLSVWKRSREACSWSEGDVFVVGILYCYA